MKNASSHWNQIGKSYAIEWNKEGKKYVSDLELKFLKDSISKYVNKKNHQIINALDLGFGAGRILSTLESSRTIDTLTGVDFSKEMLLFCKNRFKNSKKVKKLIQFDISKKLPFKNETFDIVTSIRAIKYSSNWRDILKECHRILKKNGIFIFEMPNPNSINRFSSDEVFLYKSTPKELKQILVNHNFEILKIKGGPILPGPLYNRIKGPLLGLAMINEKYFKMVFGETFLSRFIYIACRKI